jgi:hypothetical protein
LCAEAHNLHQAQQFQQAETGYRRAVETSARTCAWLEALTGQFNFAVLVAGLVGSLLSKSSDAKKH